MPALPPPPPDLYEVDATGRLVLNCHPGQTRVWLSRARFLAILAGTQSGKALAIDTPIPTPSGFRSMGEIEPGDDVFDETGAVCRVTGVSPVYTDHDCFRVVFDDGTAIVADADHRWLTSTFRERKNAARRVAVNARADRPQCRPGPVSSVRTTREILETIRCPRGGNNHSVRVAGPADFPERELTLAPYTFGVWLGDGTRGTANVTTEDPGILDQIRADGYSVGPARESNSGNARTYSVGYTGARGGDLSLRRNPVLAALRSLGVIDTKDVPAAYLFASPSQRLALLQGLMDTDGWCEKDGQCCFGNSRPWISAAVDHLAKSLGCKTKTWERPTAPGETSYCVAFYTKTPVFRLPRKAERQTLWKRRGRGNSKCDHRYIVSVEPLPSVPVKCVSVNSPNRLYLAGESFVPTHNTSWGPFWLWREIYGEGNAFPGRGEGDYIAVTASYDLFKLKMLPALREVFETLLGVGRYWPGARMMELKDPVTGRFWARKADDPMWGRVILRSAEAGGGLESSTAKAAWLDEAGQNSFTDETWRAVLSRLSLNEGRALITTTLYNFGWLKTEFHDRWKAGDKDYEVVHFDSVLNPRFPRAEWERARRTMPGWRFDMRYRGRFSRPAGQIYDCYSDEMIPLGHLVPRFPVPAHWPRFVGLDFGGANTAAVFLAYDPADGTCYAYREYLQGHKTAGTHRAELLAGDPGLPVCFGGSGSEQQWRDEFKASGLTVHRPPVGEVEIGIASVWAAIAAGKLRVFQDLTGLRSELVSYARKLGPDGEPTAAIDDKSKYHRLDALRYIGSHLWQNIDGRPPAGPPTVTTAARVPVVRHGSGPPPGRGPGHG